MSSISWVLWGTPSLGWQQALHFVKRMLVCKRWPIIYCVKELDFDCSAAAAAAAKLLQSCPTLCDPIDSSPPGFTVPGILQVRTLEWVAISFSSAWKWSESEVSQSCPTLRPHGLQPTRLLHQWDFPGKSTGVGCHCLLRIAQLLAGKPASSFPRGKSVLSS